MRMLCYGIPLVSRTSLDLRVRCINFPRAIFYLLTHRAADFPVMPIEKLVVSLKPTSFFELNPSNDVPRSNQSANKSILHTVPETCCHPSRI
jgi:hypothetical protein